MTKDYAKQRSPHSTNRPRTKTKTNTSVISTSIIVALCFGLGLGFGGSWFANHSGDNSIFARKDNAPVPEKSAPPKSRMRASIEEVPPPSFDFYTLLPNSDLEAEKMPETVADATPIVTEPSPAQVAVIHQTATLEDAADPISSPALKQALSSTTPNAVLPGTAEQSAAMKLAFVIQAGSFKNPAAAEKLKAKLAFKGLQSKIEAAPTKGGDTWYRVVIGPLATQTEAKTIQAQLQDSENLNSLVLRVRV